MNRNPRIVRTVLAAVVVIAAAGLFVAATLPPASLGDADITKILDQAEQAAK